MSETTIITVRDIQTVETEIIMIRNQVNQVALNGAIEIGRRLTEAKSMLPHGEWGSWLKEKVDISQSAAQNFMKLFDEYGDAQITLLGAVAKSQTFGNLPYTKALRLLSIPENEREAFAEENDIANKSVREIDRLIKERDAVAAEKEKIEKQAAADRKALEGAQRIIVEARDLEKKARDEEAAAKKKATTMERELEEARKNEKRIKEELEKQRRNPTIPAPVLEKMRSEAAEKAAQDAEKARKELEEQLKKANAAAAEASERADLEKQKREAAEKRLAVTNSDAVVFGELFKQAQEIWNKMDGTLLKVEQADPALADKLRSARAAVLQKWGTDDGK